MPTSKPPNATSLLPRLNLARFAPAIMLMLAIWVSSSQRVPTSVRRAFPASPGASVDACDVLHAGVYALLALLFIWAIRPSFRRAAPCLVLGWVLTCLYGGVDELHQAFVPDRTAAVLDLLMDAAGAVLGVSLYAGFGVLLGKVWRTIKSRAEPLP